ncbi:MAG: hypothetical protein LBF40_02695 [Deltaproteobacteria bacterium]|jgi:hypothetical protein|nr:hypothetical protein [Deltaproteobacteria bacterium]
MGKGRAGKGREGKGKEGREGKKGRKGKGAAANFLKSGRAIIWDLIHGILRPLLCIRRLCVVDAYVGKLSAFIVSL